jgi:ribosomal protein S18 acetylase RimI-like enzyme
MGKEIGRLQPIDPKNKPDVEAIAGLHSDLLDWGPISKLGGLFLKRLVYSQLILDNLIEAALFKVEGTPAGFVSFTAYSDSFLSRALKKHWIKVPTLLATSIVQDPRTLFRLVKALRLAGSIGSAGKAGEKCRAEILAIGVLPEYREPHFVRTTGIHISRALVAHAVSYFRNLGLRRMHLYVDEFNKPTIYFYQFMGGRSELCRRAGENMIRISFDLDKMEI